MRLLFIGIQNFLSGCGLMALLILWGLFRRLKEIVDRLQLTGQFF